MAAQQRRRRADAERSIGAIVDAAVDVFADDPDASMTHIANAAGVGRVTLYAHFPSREAVLEAVVEKTITDAAETLGEVDLADDQAPADELLIRALKTSWRSVDRFGRIHVAAESTLGREYLRKQHDPIFQQVEDLIARGQRDGLFRTDLPLDWLVSTVYVLVHGAADQVAAGRVSRDHVADYLVATVVGALKG